MLCVFVSVRSALGRTSVTRFVCSSSAGAVLVQQNNPWLCCASKCPLEKRAFNFPWACSYLVEMHQAFTQTDFSSPALAGISTFPSKLGIRVVQLA